MNTRTHFKTVGLMIVGLLVLTAAVRGEMRLGKTAKGQKDKAPDVSSVERHQQATPALVRFQGILPETADGIHDLRLSIYADSEQTQLLGEKVYPSVAVGQGIYSLNLPAGEFGLEVGKDYWVIVEAEEGLTNEMQVSILPREKALAGSEDSVTTGRYKIEGEYADYVVWVRNTSTGYGVVGISEGGVGIGAKTTTGPAALEAVHDGGGVAISAVGDVEVEGHLRADSIEYPAGSVDSGDILDGTIVDVDISPAAGIAAGKIAAGPGSGLDADQLDGKDSGEFVGQDINGNVTISGKLGIGIPQDRAPLAVGGLNNAFIDWNETGTASQWRWVVRGDTGTFAVEDQASTLDNVLAIEKATGKIGIGTLTPAEKLDVLGIIKTQGGIKFADDTLQTTATQTLWKSVPETSNIYYDQGNVGIGTTEPKRDLHIKKDFAEFLLEDTRLTPDKKRFNIYMDPGANTTHFRILNDEGTTGVGLLTFDNANGNVGIGTANPQAPGSGAKSIVLQGDNYPQYITYAANAAADSKIWRFIGRSDGTAQIQTLDDNYANEATVIGMLRNGNVGIGTTDPDNELGWPGALEVNGQVKAALFRDDVADYYADLNTGGRLAGSWNIEGSLTIAQMTANGNLIIDSEGPPLTIGGFMGGGSGRLDFAIGGDDPLGNTVLFFGTRPDQGFKFGTFTVQAVDSNFTGNINAGGKITAQEIEVNSTGADFVFAKDYKLRSLDEVQEFIEQKGHLPEIPPAAEMQSNGVNVSEMQTKLLQKVEELTLYVIAQEKIVNDLRERLAELEKRKSP